MDYPEIHLNVNRLQASLLGLTEQQILSDVVTGLSSNISGDPGYWIDPKTNNAYFVVAQYPEQNLTPFEDFLLTPLVGTNDRAPGPDCGRRWARRVDGVLAEHAACRHAAHAVRRTLLGEGHREPVFLKDVVEVRARTGPETIDHYDLQRSMDVMFAVVGNDLGGVARQVEEKLAKR